MSNSDFFSFLVDETLRLQEGGEAKLSRYELKLTDYSLSYLKGEFIPQIQVLRFKGPLGMIDIPVNWSFFEDCSEDIVLSKENDKEHFFEVLSSAWNPQITKMLITHADGFCYLIALKAEEEIHLRDLQNHQEWLEVA